MALLIGGKTREQHTRASLVDAYGESRLSRLPAGAIIPPGTTAQSAADQCIRHANEIVRLMADIPSRLKRWKFLDTALEAHSEPSDAREQALQRCRWYRGQVRADLLEIVRHEYRADASWRFLEVEERDDLDVALTWSCDPERESLIGLVYRSGHPWARCLGPDFDLKATVGFIPDLSRIQPYRVDLRDYIALGYLDGDVGADYSRAKETAARKEVIIAHAKRRKTLGKPLGSGAATQITRRNGANE